MWALLIILITFVPIVISYLYFRKQKELCEKYPFFALRDNIIWEMIKAGNTECIQKSYEKVNFVAKKLKDLNFGFVFFMEAMAASLGDLIEEKYREALRDFSIKHCPLELDLFDKELAMLIIDAARKNSLLLRFAMTKTGFRILFFPLLGRAVYQFMRRHPNFFKNRRAEIRMMQKYSVLAQCV